MDDVEAKSIEFLEFHVEKTFKKLMNTYIIEDIQWIDAPDHSRPYARMLNADAIEEKDFDSNVIVLFPPFFPNGPNNLK